MTLGTVAGTVEDYLSSPRRMLVGEELLDAASGATLSTENPATGRTIATVPAGDARDVDRAVAAARASFASRVKRGTAGPRRAEVMWRYFMEPTIFTGGRPDMRIVQEEIFGPVLTVMPFKGFDDLARLGNASHYGLGAGIYTRDLSNAHRGARLLDVGNVWVNCYGLRDKSLPFGGFKQSGWGRENGPEGLDAFLESKAVYMKL